MAPASLLQRRSWVRHDRHLACPDRPPLVLDCIYYALSIAFFVYMLLLLLDRRRRADAARHDADPGHLRPLHAAVAARERSLSELPPLANYAIARGLLRVFALLRLLHEHELRGARHRARRHVGYRRPDHGAA